MRILVTGGGTGGHIYPAISIALAYKERHKHTEILYVGRQEGLESEIVPNHGLEYESIPITYLKKKTIRWMVKYVVSLCKALLRSRKIINDFKPDVIIGTGGYVTGPLLFMGQQMGVKTVLHESNAFPGKANRFFSKKAHIVFISYEGARKHFTDASQVILSGTPVRKEFSTVNRDKSRQALGINDDEFLVVSFGGSGGAKKLNESVMELMKKLSGEEKLRYIHVTGKAYYNVFLKRQLDLDIRFEDNVSVMPYIEDMPLYMSAADLLITRGGALTLSELMVLGTPSILVPSPNVTDNHQEHNVRALSDQGAAILLKEDDMDYFTLYQKIESLKDNPKELADMRQALSKLSENDATSVIVKALSKLK
jgi:UDP-N-acetylglucosamine--N-acetylmuramyl-(pentapeptide) pyrophosphoryl-undecaprenol N-acetylglucosamine transferase